MPKHTVTLGEAIHIAALALDHQIRRLGKSDIAPYQRKCLRLVIKHLVHIGHFAYEMPQLVYARRSRAVAVRRAIARSRIAGKGKKNAGGQ